MKRENPRLWIIDDEGTLARHEETGIEVRYRYESDVLHVQTDPEKYGLDIPMWLVGVLAREGKGT